MEKILLAAAAKLNFSLDIKGRRPDGYHLMEMVMQTVSLYDAVALTKGEDIRFSCGDADIPGGETNTAVRAAKAFFAGTGVKGGVSIALTKAIPSEAGMAGGSADAAAVLVGLNALYETGLSLEELSKLGLTVGADVPYCLCGGTALVEGIGEIVTPVPQMRRGYIVIIKPVCGVSTAEAFRRFDAEGCSRRPDTYPLIQNMAKGKLDLLAGSMANVLEQCQTLPLVEKARKRLLDQGALCAMMTGSGSAVFGVFDREEAAQKAASALRDFGERGEKVYLTKPVPRGVEILATE